MKIKQNVKLYDYYFNNISRIQDSLN